MARERRLFTEEFKREAVKLVNQPGATKAAIARDLGVGPNLLVDGAEKLAARHPLAPATARRCRCKITSACGASWRRLRRSATY
jgi:transposase-like protein